MTFNQDNAYLWFILIEHLFRPPSQGQANSHKRKSIHRTDHKEPEKSKLRPPLTLYLMTDQSLVKRKEPYRIFIADTWNQKWLNWPGNSNSRKFMAFLFSYFATNLIRLRNKNHSRERKLRFFSDN